MHRGRPLPILLIADVEVTTAELVGPAVCDKDQIALVGLDVAVDLRAPEVDAGPEVLRLGVFPIDEPPTIDVEAALSAASCGAEVGRPIRGDRRIVLRPVRGYRASDVALLAPRIPAAIDDVDVEVLRIPIGARLRPIRDE